LLHDLIARQAKNWGPQHWKTQFTTVVLANNLMLQKRFDQAAELLPGAVEVISAALGAADRRTLMAESVLGYIDLEQQKFAQALPIFTAVHDGFTRQYGENNQGTISYLSNLAYATQYNGDPRGAEPLYQRALTSALAILQHDNPQVQLLRYRLADCLLDLERPDEAAALLKDLDANSLRTSSQLPAWDALIAYQAGRLALQRGDAAAALPLLRKAIGELGTQMAPTLATFRKRDGDLAALASSRIKR
jgi:tetratricopeptide (TPR) repeat protein